ncbi:MAG: hypothetical protein GY856_46730, partial [bacterium]|nr:hypothetical protein [bacterium]
MLQFLRGHSAGSDQLVPWGSRMDAIQKLEKKVESGKLAPPAKSLTYSWDSIGPNPLIGDYHDWAEYTGRVTSIATHPTNLDIVYLGTANGGVWKTVDRGVTWVPKTDQAISLAIGSVAVAPSNPSVVYAGTGEGNLSCDSYFGAGILKSTDGGETWVNISRDGSDDPFDNVSISKVIVHPTNPDILWVATTTGQTGNLTCPQLVPVGEEHQYGVWLSVDGGLSWITDGPVFDAKLGGRDDSVTDLTLIPNSVSPTVATLVAGVRHYLNPADSGAGIWRLAFTNLTSPGGPTLVAERKFRFCNENNNCPTCDEVCSSVESSGRVAIAVDPQYSSVLYAAATSSYYWKALYRSADGGNTWVQLDDPPPSNECQGEFEKTASCTYGTPGCCHSETECSVHSVCERYPEGSANGNSCHFALELEVDYQSRVWIGGIGIWRGEVVGGTSVNWTDVGNWMTHVDQHAIAFFDDTSANQHAAWAGNDGGVMLGDNAQTPFSLWNRNGDTLAITQFHRGAS